MRTLLFAVVLLGTAACSSSPVVTPSPTPPPVLGRPLLTLTMRGGLCVPGACETTYYVEQDGRVHLAAKPPNEVGHLDEAGLAEIRAQIAAADFDEIRSHPFTGTCPTAFDGQELVLEFGTAAGPVEIASCEVAIDWNEPLFAPIAFAFEPLLGDLTRF